MMVCKVHDPLNAQIERRVTTSDNDFSPRDNHNYLLNNHNSGNKVMPIVELRSLKLQI